jgi:hypothetical protein
MLSAEKWNEYISAQEKVRMDADEKVPRPQQ